MPLEGLIPGTPPEGFYDAVLQFARASFCRKHGIHTHDLDAVLEVNDDLRAAFEDYLDDLRRPSNILEGGIRIFEVTEDEGHLTVVRSYRQRPVPNQRTRAIQPVQSFNGGG